MASVHIFISDHVGALERAQELDDADAVTAGVRIPDISDYELEQGAQIAADTMNLGVSAEVFTADITSDSLHVASEDMLNALEELSSYEDDEQESVIESVAATWVEQEQLPFGATEAQEYLERISELAAQANADSEQELYIWVEQD